MGLKRKEKKLLRNFMKKESQFEKNSGLSIGVLLIIIGGVWYAAESGFLDLNIDLVWPIGLIIIGALLLFRKGKNVKI